MTREESQSPDIGHIQKQDVFAILSHGLSAQHPIFDLKFTKGYSLDQKMLSYQDFDGRKLFTL